MMAEVLALLVSQFVMAYIADNHGRRLVVCTSMTGSRVRACARVCARARVCCPRVC